MRERSLPSPLGPVTIVVDDGAAGLLAIDFRESRKGENDDAPLLREAERQLRAYFDGKLAPARFDLPLAAPGTEFQKRVWSALLDVKHGHTTTYAALASKLGSVARAVGGANGANPIAIVVPCHRVIGADGSLTGYAGGLERKRWLLRHEGAVLV